MNILLNVAYDGTNYFGWQRQKNDTVVTIEQKLYEACYNLFRKDVKIIGASRTDRGVHALGQKALIIVDTNIPILKIPHAINTFLPDDIVVNDAVEVCENFNPRYDCIKKTYRYRIFNGKYRNPIEKNFSEFVYGDIDISKMQKASHHFKGTHDFKGFCSSQSDVKSTVRTIFDIHIESNGNIIDIYVTGDGFLYNMVRIIAGTLIDVGISKINYNDIKDIIKSRNRNMAGKTVSPKGLTLMKIYY